MRLLYRFLVLIFFSERAFVRERMCVHARVQIITRDSLSIAGKFNRAVALGLY